MHSFVCVFIGEKMTEQTTGQNTSNPLQKYFRQPKLHVRLPSGGKYYPPGSLDLPESGEVAIYPLTAKDELLLKSNLKIFPRPFKFNKSNDLKELFILNHILIFKDKRFESLLYKKNFNSPVIP